MNRELKGFVARVTQGSRTGKVVLAGCLLTAGAVVATPPLGFVVNQIVAMGVAGDDISQQVQVASDGSGDPPWQAQLQAQGGTDFYIQQLELAPGGYSGWHTHPGILVGTVLSGSIDFYDANCQKKTIQPGRVFIENSQTHAISNTGSIDAVMNIAYLVKHNAARRLEADAPACATTTGIP